MGVDIVWEHPSQRASIIIKRVASLLLKCAGLSQKDLSLYLVSDEKITQINKQWLNRPWPTNVISFSQSDDLTSNLLGDIVISLDTARREAEEAGVSLENRLIALIAHGLVHIMGYDHEGSNSDKISFEKKEKELLKAVAQEKIMADLCINVDHVATIRQARGGVEPDPVAAAVLVELAGADGIVVHLREDRRHIQDRDVKLLRQLVQTRLTLEMAATEEMLKIASEIKPDIVTLVPEKREEITTEGGLDVVSLESHIAEAIEFLHKASIPVSLFVDPEQEQIEASKRVGAECIEIHTGRYAEASSPEQEDYEYEQIAEMARIGSDLGLRVHAGHGLNYQNTARLAALPEIVEFSIGHSIISRAVMVGMEQAVKEMLSLVKKGRIV